MAISSSFMSFHSTKMRLLSPYKSRQLHRTLRNMRVSLICFFLTVLVLRNTIGAGKFGTPAQDFEEIRQHLHKVRLGHRRALAQALETPSDEDSSKSSNPNVLLVTVPCRKSSSDRLQYSISHNTRIVSNRFHSQSGFGASLRSLMLAHPAADWLWWMDSDIFISDTNFKLPFENYTDFNLVLLHSFDGVEKSFSTSSFLIKNCQWSLDLLRDWDDMVSVTKTTDFEPENGQTKTLSDAESAAFRHALEEKGDAYGDKVFWEDSFYLWQIDEGTFSKNSCDNLKKTNNGKIPFLMQLWSCKECAQESQQACMNQVDMVSSCAKINKNSLETHGHSYY